MSVATFVSHRFTNSLRMADDCIFISPPVARG
jgi:hypothetical protein